MSESKWYLPNRTSQEALGPYTDQQVRDWLRAGSIRMDEYIYGSHWAVQEWMRIDLTDEFRDAVSIEALPWENESAAFASALIADALVEPEADVAASEERALVFTSSAPDVVFETTPVPIVLDHSEAAGWPEASPIESDRYLSGEVPVSAISQVTPVASVTEVPAEQDLVAALDELPGWTEVSPVEPPHPFADPEPKLLSELHSEPEPRIEHPPSAGLHSDPTQMSRSPVVTAAPETVRTFPSDPRIAPEPPLTSYRPGASPGGVPTRRDPREMTGSLNYSTYNRYRRFPRTPIRAEAILHDNQNRFLRATCVDISENGVFVHVANIDFFDKGEELMATVRNAPGIGTFSAPCAVVRVITESGERGYGLSFLRISPVIRRQITRYVLSRMGREDAEKAA